MKIFIPRRKNTSVIIVLNPFCIKPVSESILGKVMRVISDTLSDPFIQKIVKKIAILHDYRFFMYVTKTHANLTTYSRNPGNYNGKTIFEIDIMKKSSLLNLEFKFLLLSKPK